MLGQLGAPVLSSRQWRGVGASRRRHHVVPRAGLGEQVTQQLQAAGQQAVQELGAKLSGSGLGDAFPGVERAVETLRELATEPHWGTYLLRSAVDRWATAAAQFVGAAVPAGGQVTEQLQRGLAQLREAAQHLPELAAPQGGGSGVDALRAYADSLAQSAQELEQALAAAASSAASAVGAGAVPQLQLPVLGPLPATAGSLAPTDLLAIAGLAGVWVLVAAAWTSPPPPSGGSGSGGGRAGGNGDGGARQPGDYLPSTYNAEECSAYFAAHPVMVLHRGAQVAAEAASFGAMLLLDNLQGKLEANSPARAAQLRGVIERLGPAYVKVAQALSTRVDLLSPPYLLEIERLQDRVPPFDDAAAFQMIAAAYGRPVEQLFSSITPRAVAAASLGQVYRGVLRESGQEVAVKVRRPGVLEAVALDLHIMRQAALALRQVPEVKSDWVAIIDKWAEAFFAEMDYSLEAANARRFKRDVEEKQLNGIVVPEVFLDSHEVLVTQWIEGEKLSESNAADVRELCNTLLSAYLTQLLETGFLHADPHPGNLLRTPDGKIAVLDYGLMTTVPPDYSLALVEYIAHLSVGDYEAIVDDLVALGFMAEGGDREGLAEPLGVLLAQLSQGGGAANVNIDLVMAKIEELADRYPIQVPAYFALILRCFSVIEGIALRVDPQYAIVSECFPYLCRRLLTDNHPRARRALRELLFGQGRHVDLDRLARMADGFGNYTVAGLTDAPRRRPAGARPGREDDLEVALAGAAGPEGVAAALAPVDDVAGDRRPLLSPAAKEALLVLFSRQGNYAQELLVEQAVATVDAGARQAAAVAVGRLLGSAPALAGLSAIEALGPWRSLLLPVPTPLEVLSRVAPTLQPSDDDLRALETARGVVDLIQRAPSPLPGPPSPSDAVRLAQELGPLLPQLLPGVVKTGELFTRQLVRRAALRVAADMQLNPEEGGRSGTRGGAADV